MTAKKKTQVSRAKKKTTEYDSAWKDVIENLFESFLEFFFPDIHKDIDFSKKITFLRNELGTIKPYGNVGRRYADELVKVYLKDGSTACICVFIHVEVQGTKEKEGIFEERTYIYNYRIFDKNIEKGAKVVSLAILTDEDPAYRPDEYRVSQWGFELRMKIPMVKIIDYKNNKELRETLESSTNPMAMVVLAQLKSYELKKADDTLKSTVKWELLRQCILRRYPKPQIDALMDFIDWLVRLPEELEKQISEKIEKLEEDYKMAYVASWKRIAQKEYEEIGVRKGEEIGLKKGIREGKLEAAGGLLKNGVAADIIAKSLGMPIEEIKKLAETVH